MRSSDAIRNALLIAVVLTATAAYAQNDCMDFNTGARSLDPFYEYYLRAERTVNKVSRGEQPSASDLDAAINDLRNAITANGTPRARERDNTGREFPYHPYLQLAMLEAARGRAQCVKPLLARENRNRLPSQWAGNYDKLMAGAEAFEKSAIYVALATEVDRVIATGQLSAEGSAKGEGIKTIAAQIPSANPDNLANLNSTMSRDIVEMARIEGRRVRAELDAIRNVAPSALSGIDTGPCADPADTEDPAVLRAMVDTTLRCVTTGIAAYRSAGPQACAALQQDRDAVRNQLDLVAKLGSSGGDAPARLPAACAQAGFWDDKGLDDLAREFNGLDFANLRTAYASNLSAAQQQVAGLRASFLNDLQSQEDRIFTAPSSCERTLALNSANRRLRQIQSTIRSARDDANVDPAATLRDVRSGIDQAAASLASLTAAGADRLLSQREEMAKEGVDVSSFDGLQSVRGRVDGSSFDQSMLTAVCNAAQGVDAVIADWSVKNLPRLASQARAYRWFLATTAQVAGGVDTTCIDASLTALPRNQPGGAGPDWATSTRTAISQAGACLSDVRTTRSAWIDGLETDLTRSVASLTRLTGVAGLPQGVLDNMRRELEASLAGLTTAKGVMSGSESDSAALRSSLQGAGLDVPADSWQQLGGLDSGDVEKGLEVVRDQATGALVGGAADSTTRWSDKIDKLTTFSALDGALSRFSGGDLDGAIRDLRGWAPGASIDPQTRALRHATLGFFLHTKWSVLSSNDQGRDAGSLLYEDATREVRAALQTDPSFELPSTLKNDPRFQQFVVNCRM